MKTNQPTSYAQSIEVETSEWIARRDAGFTPDEQVAFDQWLAADHRHALAWQRHAKMWNLLDHPRSRGGADAMVLELKRRSRRRSIRRALYSSAGVGLFLMIAFFVNGRIDRGEGLGSRMIVVAPEQRILEDGTQVELRPGAWVEAEFTPEQRRVRLVKGEAHFHVTSNPTRPFIVMAKGVEVRAVGTAFAVNLAADGVGVLVTEGKVAVESVPPLASAPELPVTPAAAPVALVAGERVVVEPESVGGAPAAAPVVLSVPPAELEERLAWRTVRLEFTGTPLAQALELMNRYNAHRLVIEDPSLSRIEVSGYFRANNTDSFLQLLEGSFGIAAEKRGEVIYLRKLTSAR